MRYDVGMYGGSFDPLHIGHIHDIIRAACVCRELYVMISWCEGRESVSKELRYRWIYYCTRHLPNVRICCVEDKAVSKEEYDTDYYWENGAHDIKEIIGKKINAVFCGSDYLGKNRFEPLYPEAEVIYFDRSEVPISSTELRFDVYENWQYIPRICRPYYARRILIIGSESTGKSTLVQNLANAYNTSYVREVGRETCERAGGEEYMTVEDLYENIIRQKEEELKALYNSNRLLFVDTDALTTEFYSDFLLTDEDEKCKCSALAEAVADINRFDIIFFLEPSVDFIQDGTRNEKILQNRSEYSEQLKKLFNKYSQEIVSIGGDHLDRFNIVKQVIEQKTGIKTIW